MSRVRFTKAAIRDLKAIWNYIAADNVNAADNLHGRLEKRWKGLSDQPGIGRKREEIRPTMRSVTEGNYAIYYRSITGGIEIVRVLHISQDVGKSFSDQEPR